MSKGHHSPEALAKCTLLPSPQSQAVGCRPASDMRVWVSHKCRDSGSAFWRYPKCFVGGMHFPLGPIGGLWVGRRCSFGDLPIQDQQACKCCQIHNQPFRGHGSVPAPRASATSTQSHGIDHKAASQLNQLRVCRRRICHSWWGDLRCEYVVQILSHFFVQEN